MNWIQRKILLYNVTFGLYMLDWWERYLFNIMIVVLLWFVCYNGSRSATEFYTSHLKIKLGMEGLDLNNLIGHQKNGSPHGINIHIPLEMLLGGKTTLERYLGHYETNCYETPIQLEREKLRLGYAQLGENLIHINFRLDCI